MIQRLPDMPPGVVGFRVDGEVEREDYEHVLVPALHTALESTGQLRTLYLIFAWMIPGQARVYPVAELAAATAWVSGAGD